MLRQPSITSLLPGKRFHCHQLMLSGVRACRAQKARGSCSRCSYLSSGGESCDDGSLVVRAEKYGTCAVSQLNRVSVAMAVAK